MALKDIQIPKVEVKVAEGSKFAVRGLSTSDIEHLVRAHGSDLRGLFTELMTGKMEALKSGEMGPVLNQLIGRVPGLVVDLIALAADAEDAADRATVKKLPTAVQMDALVKIATLTLSTDGDLGNAAGVALQAVGLVNQGMAEAMLKAAS